MGGRERRQGWRKWDSAPAFALLLVLLFATLMLEGAKAEGAEGIKVPRGYTLKIIGGVEYLMDSAYLWNPRYRWSGEDSSFAIHAYFPDLAPLGPSNKHIADMPGGNQYMYGLLVSRSSISVAQRFKNSQCGIDPAASPYGLIAATCILPPSLNDTYAIVNNRILIAFVRCSRLPMSSPGCDLLFDHLANDVIAHFPKRLLSDAAGVHREIVHLLDGFVHAAHEARDQAR